LGIEHQKEQRGKQDWLIERAHVSPKDRLQGNPTGHVLFRAASDACDAALDACDACGAAPKLEGVQANDASVRATDSPIVLVRITHKGRPGA
jgi:hypothetical protein